MSPQYSSLSFKPVSVYIVKRNSCWNNYSFYGWSGLQRGWMAADGQWSQKSKKIIFLVWEVHLGLFFLLVTTHTYLFLSRLSLSSSASSFLSQPVKEDLNVEKYSPSPGSHVWQRREGISINTGFSCSCGTSFWEHRTTEGVWTSIGIWLYTRDVLPHQELGEC